MRLWHFVLIVVGILVAAIVLPKMVKQPLAPASRSAISAASGSDSSYAAAMDAAANTEAVSVMGMINTACRMYGMEHSSPPASFSALVNAGSVSRADLNGSRFSQGDYTIRTLGDLGNRQVGVLSATVKDSTSGKVYELTWDSAAKRYKMDAK